MKLKRFGNALTCFVRQVDIQADILLRQNLSCLGVDFSFLRHRLPAIGPLADEYGEWLAGLFAALQGGSIILLPHERFSTRRGQKSRQGNQNRRSDHSTVLLTKRLYPNMNKWTAL